MRLRGPVRPWIHGPGLYHVHGPTRVYGVRRTYCTQPPPAPRDHGGKVAVVREQTMAVLQNLTSLGKEWGQKTITTASATTNYWWGRYEDFVGLNEVKQAQTQVTEVGHNEIGRAHV